jgi:hypothetical protein
MPGAMPLGTSSLAAGCPCERESFAALVAVKSPLFRCQISRHTTLMLLLCFNYSCKNFMCWYMVHFRSEFISVLYN